MVCVIRIGVGITRAVVGVRIGLRRTELVLE